MSFPKEIKVLVAEDDDIALELLSSLLSLNFPNIVFHTATNGRVALEIFRDHLPDVIITDFNMPEMNCIEMVAEIQALKPDVMTILITAYGDKTIQEATANAGLEIDHYLLKPINFKDLFKVLDKCVSCIKKTSSLAN